MSETRAFGGANVRGDGEILARRVIVSGDVQGVFFRDSCRREAAAAGVSGWVANRRDGKVEAHFEGNHEAVRQLIDWARHGPPGARVADVAVADTDPSGISGFRVR